MKLTRHMQLGLARIRRGIAGLARARRGSVAVLMAVAMPTMMIVAGVGLEVSEWALASARLQRAADAAAVAGAYYYGSNNDAQKAAGAAADIAELNGFTGGTRSWNSATKTLTDGSITVVLGTGISNASYTSVKVTISQTVSSSFSGVMNISNRTLTATGYADSIVTTTQSTLTDQACMLALGTTGNTSTIYINIDGSASAGGPGCAIRSNGGIELSGTGSINASSALAAGTITMSGSASITATKVAGTISKNSSSTVTGTISGPAVQIADPYKNNATLNAAFSQLSATGKPAYNPNTYGTATVSPGVWSSWNVGGSLALTMNPGLYVITGNVTFGGNATVTGTGVTIVFGGTFNAGASAHMTLTPPGTSPTGGAVPSVLLASNSSTSVTFSGANQFALTGVQYFPAAAVSFNGSTANSSSNCFELIGKTISVTGAVTFAANCGSYGAASTATGNPATTVNSAKLVK
jgi:Flp pilus assembly protein TadG